LKNAAIDMKKIFLFCFLYASVLSAQSPAGIWYFGKKAGLNFNTGNNPVSLNDGQIETAEGCATLCDNSGNLLFYTDGIKIWNKNHLVMPNGSNLLGNPSSTQSAVIVPQPNSPNLFYVFTVAELGGTNGLRYSVIDLNLDGGNGDITTTKNVSLITPALEKITVVQHANNTNYWIIAHRYGNNQFVAYELTAAGLSATPVITNVGVAIANSSQKTLGYLKSSPDGKYIGIAHAGAGSVVQILNFNNASGQLTFQANLPIGVDDIGAYGLEFSSNSKVLYVTRIDQPNEFSQVLQYDLNNPAEAAIIASQTIIASFNDEFREGIFTALQLAPNQKIYVGRNNSATLSAIDNPNTVGIGCNFNNAAVSIAPNICYFGLPSFITSFLDLNFTSNNYCFGSATQFTSPNIPNLISAVWDFDDPTSANPTSIAPNPTHTFTSIGTYNVTLTVSTSTTPVKIFSRQIQILSAPIANSATPYFLCETATNAAIFDLNSKTTEILGPTQLPANYSVSYHTTLLNAQNNTNPIASLYTNTSNPQTIFARINSNSSTDCYDTTSFTIEAKIKPNLKADEDLYYCKNKFPELLTFDSGVTGSTIGLTCLWSTGQTTNSISVNQVGTYNVVVTNQFGCTSSRTVTVIESDIAIINYTISGPIGNNSLQIIPTGSGNYEFSLDNINGPFQTSPIFNSLAAGDHIIYVKDTFECGTAKEEFSIIGYSNFFTPNGDGNNDYWNLLGRFIKLKQTLIYDRYGKLMHVIYPNQVGWNGRVAGVEMLSTDYWFVTTLQDGTEFKGHFSLKR
jgi:gliding motility-associated-like protein